MQNSALSDRLTATLVDFAWDEWAQMGVLSSPSSGRRWAQDPEALLLLTFEIARDDPRLFDEVLDWLARNEPLVSARRLRRLCADETDERLVGAALEWTAAQRGRHAPRQQEALPDASMEPLFRTGDLPALQRDPAFAAFGFHRAPAVRSGKSREPDLRAPINFAFRLRQLLGVGTRAEAVRYLLTAGVEASALEVSTASAFAKRNVYEALTSLHEAGVVTLAAKGSEQRFAVDPTRWAHFLGFDSTEIPVYRDWPALFGALRKMVRWLRDPELEGLSEYLLASRAADVLDELRPAVSAAGVLMPARVGGARSWQDFEETAEFILQSLSPTSTIGASGRFETVPDASGGYRWRLTGGTGRIVAISIETHSSEIAARAAVDRLRDGLDHVTFRAMSDAGSYRWGAVAENGRMLAISSESFATMRDADKAASVARTLIEAAAAPLGAASDTVDPDRRHVTPQPDGGWAVRSEGASRASSVHRTQADALRAARVLAKNSARGGEVIVHARNGRVRHTDTIARDR